MNSPEQSARLRYLNDAAHLLMTMAPTTSKYLMSRCNSLIFDSGLERSESQRRQTCGACGTIMVTSWEATVQVQSQRSRRNSSKTQKVAPNPTKEVVYNCDSCGKKTHFKLPPAAAKRKAVVRGGQKTAALQQGKLQPSQIVTASSSSKKRAKARKGGLEALLASKKATGAQQPSFSLDLMDFMTMA